jgi:hypothetical protein
MKSLKIIGLALCAASAIGCGEDDADTTANNIANNTTTNNATTNNAATNNATTNNATTNNAATNNAATNNATAETVTVGVFKKEGESYVDQNKNLTFHVGVACDAWERMVMTPSTMDTIQEPHQHHNAADEITYVDDTLSWKEYGPEHSAAEIAATCKTKVGGMAKSVNSTEYYFDGNEGAGFYLKIVSVD